MLLTDDSIVLTNAICSNSSLSKHQVWKRELVSPAGSHWDVLEYVYFEMRFVGFNLINRTSYLVQCASWKDWCCPFTKPAVFGSLVV